MFLTASHKPEGKSVLIVNGKANIAADAGDTLRAYGKIIVNGKVLCPAGLAGLVTEKCTINGKLAVYPDEAVKYDKENPKPNPDGSETMDGVIVTKPEGGETNPKPEGGETNPNPEGGKTDPNPDGGEKKPEEIKPEEREPEHTCKGVRREARAK